MPTMQSPGPGGDPHHPTMEGGGSPPRKSLVTFAQDLASKRAIPKFHGKIKRVKVDQTAERVLYLADVIRRMTMNWLCRSGGYRRKTVCINERRSTGRIWEPPIWEALDLRFSSKSLTLLIHAFDYCSGPSEGFILPKTADLTNGDVIFLHQIVRRLFAAPSQITAFWAESLSDHPIHSPFTQLYNPDLSPFDPKTIELLQSPQYSIALSYLDKDVARHWLAGENRRSAMKSSDALPFYEKFAEFLTAWLENAMKIERYDLLIAVAEYFKRVIGHHGKSETFTRKVQGKIVVDIYSASERERFERSLGRIYKIGEKLDVAFEQCRSRAYVERTAADHLYLASYQDVYRPVSDDVRAIGRQFSGEIG